MSYFFSFHLFVRLSRFSFTIIIIIIINHLLISNAHITQEWQLIVNTAMTENQRFFTTEIDIAHITNITHEHNYNLRSERREM
jgi:hypothetical protein